MSDITTQHKYRCDLDSGPREAILRSPLMHQDALADEFRAAVYRGDEPVDLTGMAVYGYLLISATRQTILLTGTVSGSTASVTLPSECYALPGYASLVIQLQSGNVRHTVLKVDLCIQRTGSESVIDPENLLPTLPELLAQIDQMQSATEEAQAAIEGINQAVTDAEKAVEDAQQAVQDAQSAVQSVEGMTVSAQAGESANAQISEQNGVKHIHLTLPRGQDGLSPTVSTNKTGKVTTIAITDAKGTKTATINDGADGKTPVKGTDYVDGKDGADGRRGYSILRVTTSTTSSSGTGDTGIAIKYKIALSTVKAEAGVDAVYVGDLVLRSVYLYPVARVDASYVYLGNYTSIKGSPGAAGDDGQDGKDAYQYAQDGGYTGTETEFAAKLAAPLIVPEMYGAIGDGVTDDSAAIQAAINANAAVIIPPKTYAINSPITIPSNRKIQIDGDVKVNGEAGFVITGSHIEICGNGSISLPTSNLTCTAVRFLVAGTLFYVALRDFTIFGSYSTSGVQQQSIAVEFIGNETEGQCSFIEIACSIRSTYRGIYSHAAEGQHESSWFTQANIDTFVEQCVIAYDFAWDGGASQIRGAIQPRCNAAGAGQTDATLITLPSYCYFDAMIWDVDTARNNLILSIPKKCCTVWSVLDEQYMSIGEAARKTLMLRKPTDEIMSKTGGVFSGDISFAGRQVGLMLEKPDGTVERVMVQQNGLVTAGLINYTNVLPMATDTDRVTIYGDSNTPGYKANYRLSSNGAVVAHDGCYATGFIPAMPGSVVRVVKAILTGIQNLYVIAYDASNNVTGYAQWNGVGDPTIVDTRKDGTERDMMITLDPSVYGTDFNAIRISSGGFSEDTIITVNEEIDDTFDIVKSINGMTGDVQIAIPDVPVKSVNGQTGDVQIDIPTVAEWAQASSKPTYSASEVGAAPANQTLTLTGVDADGTTHTWTVYGVVN